MQRKIISAGAARVVTFAVGQTYTEYWGSECAERHDLGTPALWDEYFAFYMANKARY